MTDNGALSNRYCVFCCGTQVESHAPSIQLLKTLLYDTAQLGYVTMKKER